MKTRTDTEWLLRVGYVSYFSLLILTLYYQEFELWRKKEQLKILKSLFQEQGHRFFFLADMANERD